MPILGQRLAHLERPDAPTRLSRGYPSALHQLWAVALKVIGILGLTLFPLIGFNTNAEETKSNLAREYDLKGVFLFNFAQFVEWPAKAFPDVNTPIVIAILGDDPFGPAFYDAVRGEKVKDRPLVVKQFRRVEDLEPCQMLFICNSEVKRLSEILRKLQGSTTLTVGETEGFARRGGMFNMMMQANKVRLEINADATERSGIKVNAKLMQMAKVVNTDRSMEEN